MRSAARRPKLVGRLLAVAALALALLGVLAGPAAATEPIEAGSFVTTTSTSLAGGHPDLETSFTLASPGAPEAAKNVTFEAPQGIFGNTNAITQCSAADFALNRCSGNSQVGLITVYANYEGDPHYLLGTAPLYDLVPQAQETARFAFVAPVIETAVAIPVTVRTGTDFGLRFTVSNLTQSSPLSGAKLVFWGLPAEKAHDGERFPVGTPEHPPGCPHLATTSCLGENELRSGLPLDPFTDNPTTCTGQPLVTRLVVQTYQDQGHVSEAASSYPQITNCNRETFKPFLVASPTTDETDSGSGLNLELSAQQFEGFAASPSEIRSSVVTLPPGFTINPDAADGQAACTQAQANFGSEGPTGCPDGSKIGTFAISSPTLNGPLTGSVFIGEPQPGDQYRLFLVASGFGMNVKLVGSIKPNPLTGQLVAYFEDLPQAPFETFQLHLFAGERALMATPTACTVYPIEADFFPWDAALPDVISRQFFGITSGPHGQGCPGQFRPFDPTLFAGTANPTAGAFSPFTLLLAREDGEQYLGKLNFVMPPGLTAQLRGVTYCPDAAITAAAGTPGRVEQAAPSCPASSSIGTSNVAAGPGSHPFHATGSVYLAGPFKGAPLSLVVITPALAGPYDYGTVVVRVALAVDQTDAHVSADSEVVPSIIGGVPIRMRSIQVNIDKPSFMINPTNCSKFAVATQGVGDQGKVANFSSPFQAINCATLPFKPRMTITQTGGGKTTRRNQDPSLRFDLYTRHGDDNLKSVGVTLSKAFEIDQRHLGNICSKAQLAREHCAGRQAIGTVSAATPLLDKPLTGLAYAVSGYGKLPHLAFILGGQVTLIPEAKTTSVEGGHVKTEVPVIPDAPIGHFDLTLYGGKRGYIINSRSLCAAPVVSKIEMTAQSGKVYVQRPKAKVACGRGAKKTK
jgi:hypothetical protein